VNQPKKLKIGEKNCTKKSFPSLQSMLVFHFPRIDIGVLILAPLLTISAVGSDLIIVAMTAGAFIKVGISPGVLKDHFQDIISTGILKRRPS
jgi:hypothetical protein